MITYNWYDEVSFFLYYLFNSGEVREEHVTSVLQVSSSNFHGQNPFFASKVHKITTTSVATREKKKFFCNSIKRYNSFWDVQHSLLYEICGN